MLRKIKNRIHRWALNFVIDRHLLWLQTNGTDGNRLSFENRHIPKTIFHRANVAESEFNYAKLDRSTFWSADLPRTNFSHADLSHAVFDQANMFRCDVSTSNLRQAQHQIHIRNRQKEDLIRIFDRLDNMGDDDNVKHTVLNFLRQNEVQRPRIH